VLPIENCPDPELLDPCCTKLFDLVDSLRSDCYEAVMDCIGELDCVDPLRTWVSIDEPSNPAADYLVAWLSLMTPIVHPRIEIATAGHPGGRAVAQINVRLKETGWVWPNIEDGRLGGATDEQILAIGMHGYSHGEAMYRAASRWVSAHKCDSAEFMSFTPIAPEGNTVGWELAVRLNQDF
jgi:hypothetical protein